MSAKKTTEKKAPPPTLTEVAGRINDYLRKFEADPKVNEKKGERGLRLFFSSGAVRCGSYVRVWYVSYQGHSNLRRADAFRYLERLDAGFKGRHFEALREAGPRGPR